jgi:hypothetical protein
MQISKNIFGKQEKRFCTYCGSGIQLYALYCFEQNSTRRKKKQAGSDQFAN